MKILYLKKRVICAVLCSQVNMAEAHEMHLLSLSKTSLEGEGEADDDDDLDQQRVAAEAKQLREELAAAKEAIAAAQRATKEAEQRKVAEEEQRKAAEKAAQQAAEEGCDEHLGSDAGAGMLEFLAVPIATWSEEFYKRFLRERCGFNDPPSEAASALLPSGHDFNTADIRDIRVRPEVRTRLEAFRIRIREKQGSAVGTKGSPGHLAAKIMLRAKCDRDFKLVEAVARRQVSDPSSNFGVYPEAERERLLRQILRNEQFLYALVPSVQQQSACGRPDDREIETAQTLMLPAELHANERRRWGLVEGDVGHARLDTNVESRVVLADNGKFPWERERAPKGATFVSKSVSPLVFHQPHIPCRFFCVVF